MPPEKPPHPGDIQLPGWPKPLPGACRGGPEGTDKVNGMYANKDSQTQQQCAEKCLSHPTCTGYHHGPYCSIFGPDIHLEEDGEVWFANQGNETVITGTKVNPQYICFASVPAAPPVEVEVEKEAEMEEDMMSDASIIVGYQNMRRMLMLSFGVLFIIL